MERYTINEVAMMTGFSTRTLRNYIKLGLLDGEKEDGIWKFTAKNFNDFVTNPNVSAGLTSKRNAQIFDFLADDKKVTNNICTILDLYIEDEESDEVSEFICSKINSGDVSNLRFSLSRKGKHTRIILSGAEDSVSEIMKAYYE